jgi:hypothetical protein
MGFLRVDIDHKYRFVFNYGHRTLGIFGFTCSSERHEVRATILTLFLFFV